MQKELIVFLISYSSSCKLQIATTTFELYVCRNNFVTIKLNIILLS